MAPCFSGTELTDEAGDLISLSVRASGAPPSSRRPCSSAPAPATPERGAGAPAAVACATVTEAAAAAVRAVCASAPPLRAALGLQAGAGADALALTRLAGGLSNSVFLAAGPSGGRVVVKHGLDYHLEVTSMPFDLARMATEAACMRICHAAAPGAVPAFVHFDSAAGVIASEYLEGRETLGAALIRGALLPGTGRRLGSALARVAATTSAGALGPAAFGELSAKLAASSSVSDLMYTIVFEASFDPATPGAPWPAALGAALRRRVHTNAALRAELAELAALWRAPPVEQRVLAHTDVWLGNVLVGGPGGDALEIIDFEFAAWAPAAFDIGHTLGQLALGALLVRALAESEAAGAAEGCVPEAPRRAAQEAWLLGEISAAWDAFATDLAAANAAAAAEGRAPLELPAFEDVVGYAGVVATRWAIGRFNIFAALGLDANSPAFSRACGRALRAGAALLEGRRALRGPAEVAAVVAEALAWDPLALSAW